MNWAQYPYLERAANALRGHGQAVDDAQLQYLSPLGWEHINLTGDYLWRSSAKIAAQAASRRVTTPILCASRRLLASKTVDRTSRRPSTMGYCAQFTDKFHVNHF